MRRGFLFVIAVAILACLVTIPGDLDGSHDAVPLDDRTGEPEVPADITVYGYIANISDREMNIPLSGVTVSLLDSEMERVDAPNSVVRTEEDGRFEFTFQDGTGEYISFEFEGYKVRTLPRALELVDDRDIARMMLDRAVVDENGHYALTGTSDSTSAVGMAVTIGLLYGNVMGSDDDGDFALSGASVMAVSVDTERTYTAETGPQGNFELEVPYGNYTIHAECNGFYASEPVLIGTSDATATTITLVMKEFGIGFLGGLDFAHGLMILGLVLMIVTLLTAMAIIRHAKGPDAKITVINDLSKYDEAEDDLNP